MEKKKVFMFMRYFLDEAKKLDNLKFEQQKAAFEKMGYAVSLLGLDNDGVYYLSNNTKKKITGLRFQRIPVVKKVFQYLSIYKAASTVMKKEGYFDLSYIRNMMPIPSYTNAVRAIHESSKYTVIEIPTYPVEQETKSDKRWWRQPMYSVMRYFDKKTAKYVDAYSVIGENCERYNGKPAINIVNGTDVDAYPLHHPRKADNDVHIMALSKMARWHGFDRIIRGIADYRERGGEVPVFLHLVGPDGDGSLNDWKALVSRLDLNKFVRFEGPMFGGQLDDMFDKCDIASDGLAGNIKQAHFGIDLKVAEYCSRGMPFICCNQSQSKFAVPYTYYDVPEDNSPIDIEKIIGFVRRIQLCNTVAQEMRQFAAGFSWEAQFTKVLDFLAGTRNGE